MTDPTTIQRGVLKLCCANQANLVPHRLRPDLVVRKCRVCGCRHFELSADPGHMGIRGSEI